MSASIDAGLEPIPYEEIRARQTIDVFVETDVFDEKGFSKWIEIEVTILRIRRCRGKTYILYTYPGCCVSVGRVCEGFCRKIPYRAKEIPSHGLFGRILAIFFKAPLRQRQITYH